MTRKQIIIPNRSKIYILLDFDLKQGKNGDVTFCSALYATYSVENFELETDKRNGEDSNYAIVTISRCDTTSPAQRSKIDLAYFDPLIIHKEWTSMVRPWYASHLYFTSKDKMITYITRLLEVFLQKRIKEFSSKKLIPFKEAKLAKCLESTKLIKNKEYVKKLLWPLSPTN